jgi:single-strand DNA-binding protein
MANFNKVILAGNLTRDPELRYTPKGTAVAKFGIAINRKWKDEAGETREEVTFVDCDAFGRTAEAIGQYLSKGRPIFIEGRLRLEQWEKDGRKFQKLGVVVESFQFCDQKPEASEDRQPASASARPAQASRPPRSATTAG